jgi:hypothetical protein
MDKKPLEGLMAQEQKKYSMMRQFSLLFTSPETFQGDMKTNLETLKGLARGFIGVIDSQLIAFDEKKYPKINSELRKEAEILTNIISKIEQIESRNLYEDREEQTLVHVEVEKFDEKTKFVRSLASGMLLTRS